MKKKGKIAVIILAVLICVIGAVAYVKITSYDYIGQYNELGLAKAEKNGKFGFVNERKKAVIPVEYDEVGSFTENKTVIVTKDGKQGCMNAEGTVIFPVSYSEITIGKCSADGLAYVEADDESTFIDAQGKIVYDSLEETDVWNWIKVKLGNKYGCVNENGEIILPCDYDELEIGEQHSKCADAILNGKFNFVGYDGNLLYDEIGEFNENGWAKVKRNGKYGYVDESGNAVISVKYETLELGQFGENGYAKMTTPDFVNFIDEYGEMLYQEVRSFGQNGLAAAQDEYGNWGFINESGEEVISFYYEEVGDFGANGLVKVKSDAYYGYVNELGVEMIRPAYDELGDFGENGLVLARNGKRYNFLNSIGTKQYDKVFEFSKDGVAPARINGKYFFVDKEGNRINNCVYDVINPVDENMFRMRIGAKYGLANGRGEEVASVIYDGVGSSYYEGFYNIWNGGLYGLISSDGTLVCDTLYQDIDVDKENRCLLLQEPENHWKFTDWEGNILQEGDGEIYTLQNGIASIENAGKYFIYGNDGNLLIGNCDWGIGFPEDFVFFGEKEKYGLMDSKGKLIFNAEYDDFDVCEEYLFVKKDEKYGIADMEGKMIIEPQYTYIKTTFMDEYADNYLVVAENDKYGYWDAKSLELVIPYQFDDADLFYEGRAIVKVGEKYGMINEKGQFIIAPSYDNMEYYYDRNLIEISQNGKEGLLDEKGNMILWPSYDYVYVGFTEGLIKVESDDYYGVLKDNGEWLIPMEYSSVGYDDEYNVIIAYDMNDLCHYFDVEGNEIISYGSWKSGISDDGLITVEEGKGYSLYDAAGRYVNFLEYRNVAKFFRGLSRTENWDYYCGFVNEDGETVIPFDYDDLGHFSEDGLASMYKNGKWGFIDEAGNVIVDCIYDEVQDFSNGRAAVCRDGRWGFINTVGEEVIPLQYDYVEAFSSSGTAYVNIGTGEEKQTYKVNYIGEVVTTF